VRVLGEKRQFVAVGKLEFGFAIIALEGRNRHEPDPPLNDQMTAAFALESEINVT
jgi:hypothetical protein